MTDLFIDDIKCKEMITIKEGYRIDFVNSGKDERVILVLSEANFVDLFQRMKNRCEVEGLIEVHNRD